MAVSLLCYFFYVVTTFTATMMLLLGLFNNSTLEEVRHYPRPVIITGITPANIEPRQLLVVTPETNEGLPAKEVAKARDHFLASVAKADVKRNSRQRKANILAGNRDNDGHRYTIALSYVEGSGYRPGLDGQR